MAAAAAKLAAVALGGTRTPTLHRLSRRPSAVSSSSATLSTTTVRLSSLQASTEAEAMVTTPPPLACLWQEVVQGAGDWRGLVEPLHPLLCDELVRYAELVEASYRALDLDPRSKHGEEQMLPAVVMDDGAGYDVTRYIYGAGYDVTRYIYATAPALPLPMLGRRRSCGNHNQRSRCICYVAVASDRQAARLGRRDILVSFRGTVTGSEWLANLMIALAPARFDPGDPRPDVRVEAGFLSLYTASDDDDTGSCRDQLLSEVSQLIAKHKDEAISITLAGHSMGGSLALLLGYDLAELGLNCYPSSSISIPITVYTFAGPRVGNLGFKNRCQELGVKVLRVVNVKDPVTKLPWGYVHVGAEVALDFFEPGDIAGVHGMQGYIDHLILKYCDSIEI